MADEVIETQEVDDDDASADIELVLVEQVAQIAKSIRMMAGWITVWIVLSLIGSAIFAIAIINENNSSSSTAYCDLYPNDC
jgi:hypothetical protein